jgi:hypothetical protein
MDHFSMILCSFQAPFSRAESKVPGQEIGVNGQSLSPSPDEKKGQQTACSHGEKFDLQFYHQSDQEKEPLEIAPVLSEKMVSGEIVFYFGLPLFGFRALSLEMDNLGLWQMVDLPSPPLHPVAPIGLFKKKKIVLVQSPYLIHGFLPCDQAGADDGVDLDRSGIVSLFTGKSFREQPPEEALIKELRCEGREIGNGILSRPVSV